MKDSNGKTLMVKYKSETYMVCGYDERYGKVYISMYAFVPVSDVAFVLE